MSYYELMFPESIRAGYYHYLLYMYDRVTDQRRVYLYEGEWDKVPDEDQHYLARFWFEDGNAGCDCNRSNWFFTGEEHEAFEAEYVGNPEEMSGNIYTCRDDHPLWPDKKILIEKLMCLETGEVVAVDI